MIIGKKEIPEALKQAVEQGVTVCFGTKRFGNIIRGFIHPYQSETDVLWDMSAYEYTDSMMIACSAMEEAGYVTLEVYRPFRGVKQTIWISKEKEKRIQELLASTEDSERKRAACESFMRLRANAPVGTPLDTMTPEDIKRELANRYEEQVE